MLIGDGISIRKAEMPVVGPKSIFEVEESDRYLEVDGSKV